MYIIAFEAKHTEAKNTAVKNYIYTTNTQIQIFFNVYLLNQWVYSGILKRIRNFIKRVHTGMSIKIKTNCLYRELFYKKSHLQKSFLKDVSMGESRKDDEE